MSLLQRIANGRTDLVLDLDGGLDSRVDGASLLQWCAYYGDVTALRFLLERGVALKTLGPNLGLGGAAFHGHWQLCEFLLESSADPNSADPESGELPLHNATSHPGRPRFDVVVQVLLAAGADPNRTCTVGAETGAFMRDARTRGETPLHRAAAFGSERMIGMLLDAGGDREALDAHGDSPLSWASWHCRPDAILRLLLWGGHRIHPDRNSRADHGVGPGAMENYLRGTPVD